MHPEACQMSYEHELGELKNIFGYLAEQQVFPEGCQMRHKLELGEHNVEHMLSRRPKGFARKLQTQ